MKTSFGWEGKGRYGSFYFVDKTIKLGGPVVKFAVEFNGLMQQFLLLYNNARTFMHRVNWNLNT